MRERAAWIAAAAAVVTLAAGGCGDSGSRPADTTAGVTSTPPPRTAPVTTAAVDARTRVGEAVRRMVASSYRAAVTIRQTFEVEGAPAEIERELESIDFTTRATLEAESPRRIAGTTQVPLATSSVEMRVVVHDGRAFVSRDGQEWRRLGGEVAELLAPALEADPRDLADQLGDVRAAGRTTVDGTPAERFSGTVDPSYIRQAIAPLLERVGLDPEIVDVELGSGAFLIRSSDGQLLGQQATTRASVDMSLLPGGPDGTLTVRGDTEVRFTDHGAAIRVEPPKASGTLSGFEELGAFLIDLP